MDMRPENSEHYPVISESELEKLRQRIGVKIEKTL